jgi:hypothetical protein
MSCFVHSGNSRTVCRGHRLAARALAKKWNISLEAAIFELRNFEVDVSDAKRERARQLEAAIALVAEMKSKRARA